jgi:hypothetical protein
MFGIRTKQTYTSLDLAVTNRNDGYRKDPDNK